MESTQGVGYVPGRVVGPLCFATASTEGGVAVVEGAGLEQLGGSPAAVIVVEAAPLSHAMIRQFAYAKPVVYVDRQQAARLVPGETVLVDGSSGLIRTAQPGDRESTQAPARDLAPLASTDGVAVEVRASVSDAQGARLARQRGAGAIGLARAELLLPRGTEAPDAAACERAFKAVCEAAAPLTVTIRLADYGASKWPAWLEPYGPPRTLGLQGVRWFDHVGVAAVVEAQLQAIARLSSRWPLQVLVPFVTTPEECRRWCDYVRSRLGTGVPVGVMAETPASVLALREFKASADSVGIGCNDLLQGLFEADRDLPEVRHLLDPYGPVVFRLLRIASETSAAFRERLQLCGLLSQLPGVMPVMLGLGYRIFSVEPLMLPWLCKAIRRTDIVAAQALARAVCEAADAREVRKLLSLA